MAGLEGLQSKLFFELCRVVREADAHTAIMENVPGLRMSNGGRDFQEVLKALTSIGLSHISWRTLISAEFGIPQYRERVFIVASRLKHYSLAIHGREVPESPLTPGSRTFPEVLGFYWTASARSLCIRRNSIPALKVGAPSVKGGTSPVAIFYGRVVRKLTPAEAMRLQGFDPELIAGIKYGDALRMTGDAVTRPVGAFVVDSVFDSTGRESVHLRPATAGRIPEHGYWHDGQCWEVRHCRVLRPRHIWEFLDHSATRELSPQASAGLCCRIIRAGADVPAALFEVLYERSKTRTALVGTKVDSFAILHSQLDPEAYLEQLRNNRRTVQIGLFDD